MKQRKEIKITADVDRGTVTIRHRALRNYGNDGPWVQATFSARDFEKALAGASITLPWGNVLSTVDALRTPAPPEGGSD